MTAEQKFNNDISSYEEMLCNSNGFTLNKELKSTLKESIKLDDINIEYFASDKELGVYLKKNNIDHKDITNYWELVNTSDSISTITKDCISEYNKQVAKYFNYLNTGKAQSLFEIENKILELCSKVYINQIHQFNYSDSEIEFDYKYQSRFVSNTILKIFVILAYYHYSEMENSDYYQIIRELIIINSKFPKIFYYDDIFDAGFPPTLFLITKPILKKDNLKTDIRKLEFLDGSFNYFHERELIPSWINEEKDTNLRVTKILMIKNTFIRLEAINIMGRENFIKHLKHRVIDSKYGYELCLVSIPLFLTDWEYDSSDEVREVPYLKMRNPTTNVVHFEGVHPNCKTIEDALNWRINLKYYQKPKFKS